MDQVVVRTKFQTDNAVLDLALGGQHDDGHVRGIANGTAHALAGKLGKHEIENNEVKLMLFKFLNGRLAVTYANNPISSRSR